MEIARKFGHLKSKKCQDSNRSCWVRSANATSVLCALPIALFCAIKLQYLYHSLNFWWIFILPGRTLCRPSYSSLQREKLCHQQHTDQPPASCRRWRGRGIRRAPLWKVDVKLDWWLKLGFGTSTSELIHLKLSGLLIFYDLHYLKRRHETKRQNWKWEQMRDFSLMPTFDILLVKAGVAANDCFKGPQEASGC